MPEWPHPILRLSRRCVCKSLSILRYHCRCFLSTMTFYQRTSTLYRGRCWSRNVIINDLSPDSTTTSHRGTHVHFIVLFDLLHTLRYEFSPTLVWIILSTTFVADCFDTCMFLISKHILLIIRWRMKNLTFCPSTSWGEWNCQKFLLSKNIFIHHFRTGLRWQFLKSTAVFLTNLFYDCVS